MKSILASSSGTISKGIKVESLFGKERYILT